MLTALLSSMSILPLMWSGVIPIPPAHAAAGDHAPLDQGLDERRAQITFIENGGQWPIDARFVARTPAMIIRASPGELDLQLFEHPGDASSGTLIGMKFVGSCTDVGLEGEDVQSGLRHYYNGIDPSRWVRDMHSFARVRYHELWEGVDLVLYEGQDGFEYDLEIQPGADLERVRMRVEGARSTAVDDTGALVLGTEFGPVYQPRPRAHQIQASGAVEEIDCTFRLFPDGSVGFAAPARVPACRLVIDPTLYWATYIGGGAGPAGGADVVNAMDVDDQRNVYLTGWTTALDFPVTPGAYHTGFGPLEQILFVTKLSADGTALLYSVLIGGGGDQRGTGIAVDHQGRASVCGWTKGRFPTTTGAFDTVRNTGLGVPGGMVFRLDAAGSNLLYATYLEGTDTYGGTMVDSIAVAPSGAVVVGGQTTSTFPTTAGSFMPTAPNGHGFLTRLDPSGSGLEWSTFFPAFPTISALAVDEFDEVTLTGIVGSLTFPITPGVFGPTLPSVSFPSTFVSRLNATGSALVWSTFVSIASPHALRLTGDRGVVICGETTSTNFLTTPGAFQRRIQYIQGSGGQDGFVCRISPDATQLIYSTLLGGIGFDGAYSLDCTPSGVATVTTYPADASYPITPGSYNTVQNGYQDIGISRLDPTGSKLYYSTFLGGPGTDAPGGISISPDGRMLVVGETSGSFPVTVGSYDTTYNGGALDLFAAELDLFPVGARALGASTPASCTGTAIYLNATRMPEAGDQRFGFYCTGAPSNADGWILFGSPRTTSLNLLGVALWLDPTQPLVRRRIHSDHLGFFEFADPLTAIPSGWRVGCQALFLNPAGCTATSPYSTSNAVVITVQP